MASRVCAPTQTSIDKRDLRPRRQPSFLRHTGSGRRFPLSPHRPTTIGRSSECDIYINDGRASERHCSVQKNSEGEWLLCDHNSKNGTSLNGNQIHLAQVRPGSYITIGDQRFDVQSNDEGARSKLIGSSPSFRAAVDAAMRAARSSCSVLILGETGTGKELFAKLIHDESRRCEKPYVAVNCGAIAPTLLSSELFGHKAGAFTGATHDHQGYFAQASGGTLFLDEIGDLPEALQPAFLRALETKLIRPIGQSFEALVDVRVVAATHHDLRRHDSNIRRDLYHRLAHITIELPPLRERAEDIPELVAAFLDEFAGEYGPGSVSKPVLDALSTHAWPGNVRDLRAAVARAMGTSSTPRDLKLRDFLPEGIERYEVPVITPQEELSGSRLTPFESRQRTILATAYAAHGTIRGAADALGIPKSTFADMCKRLGVDTRRKRRKTT